MRMLVCVMEFSTAVMYDKISNTTAVLSPGTTNKCDVNFYVFFLNTHNWDLVIVFLKDSNETVQAIGTNETESSSLRLKFRMFASPTHHKPNLCH